MILGGSDVGVDLRHCLSFANMFHVSFEFSPKNIEGTHGFEPWTYRAAADCSTTELYLHYMLGSLIATE